MRAEVLSLQSIALGCTVHGAPQCLRGFKLQFTRTASALCLPLRPPCLIRPQGWLPHKATNPETDWHTALCLAHCRQDLQKDGLQASEGQGGILAQYNDPGVAPPFRRNEVLIPLQNFSIW